MGGVGVVLLSVIWRTQLSQPVVVSRILMGTSFAFFMNIRSRFIVFGIWSEYPNVLVCVFVSMLRGCACLSRL